VVNQQNHSVKWFETVQDFDFTLRLRRCPPSI